MGAVFLVEPKSGFHAGDFVARRGAIASICAGPCGWVRTPCSQPLRGACGGGYAASRAPSCDFSSQSSSCYSSGNLTTSSQVHLPSKATLSSAHFRPASLDLGLAFRWPISRARRQMRGDRIKCLGLRTDRTSCLNATDSICRRARMESQSVVKLGQWARVENAPKKAQLSKGRREARRSRPQGIMQNQSLLSRWRRTWFFDNWLNGQRLANMPTRALAL